MSIPAIPLFARSFCFLRHGETEFNARGLIAGSHETELTDLGHAQARSAAAALATTPISAIYSSPMKRALDTAAPVARSLGLPITIIDDIAERDWGSLEGRPRSQRVPGVIPADAETLEQFSARVLRGLAGIRAELPLVVAHSGVFRVLCRTLRIAEREAPVSNGLPLRFEPQPGGWQLTPLSGGGDADR